MSGDAAEPRRVHIELDLDVDADGEAPRGRAVSPGRPDETFDGWLGMFGALDALLQRPPLDTG